MQAPFTHSPWPEHDLGQQPLSPHSTSGSGDAPGTSALPPSGVLVVDAEGEHYFRPTSDEEWLAVENAAFMVAESGNLLMMRERALDDGTWMAMSQALIDVGRHTIVESPHPSPLSAHNGFFGSRPFSRTNAALEAHGQQPGRGHGIGRWTGSLCEPPVSPFSQKRD